MQQATARSSEESAIRETISAWSQAAAAKDLNKCVSFYTDDASLLPLNAPIATGKDQIRAVWSQIMSNPDYGFSWRPTKIEVAQSADVAYEMGTFDLTVAEQTANPVRVVASTSSSGKSKRPASGKWRLTSLIPTNSDATPRPDGG